MLQLSHVWRSGPKFNSFLRRESLWVLDALGKKAVFEFKPDVVANQQVTDKNLFTSALMAFFQQSFPGQRSFILIFSNDVVFTKKIALSDMTDGKAERDFFDEVPFPPEMILRNRWSKESRRGVRR